MEYVYIYKSYSFLYKTKNWGVKPMDPEFLYDEEIDELNFYSKDVIEKLLEDDEMSSEEAGFMRGYEEAN